MYIYIYVSIYVVYMYIYIYMYSDFLLVLKWWNQLVASRVQLLLGFLYDGSHRCWAELPSGNLTWWVGSSCSKCWSHENQWLNTKQTRPLWWVHWDLSIPHIWPREVAPAVRCFVAKSWEVAMKFLNEAWPRRTPAHPGAVKQPAVTDYAPECLMNNDIWWNTYIYI